MWEGSKISEYQEPFNYYERYDLAPVEDFRDKHRGDYYEAELWVLKIIRAKKTATTAEIAHWMEDYYKYTYRSTTRALARLEEKDEVWKPKWGQWTARESRNG